MWQHSRELFLSNFVLFTRIIYAWFMKRQRVKFPWDLYCIWENKTLQAEEIYTVSSIGGRLSPTSGIVNLVFSCQNDFLNASIRSLIIKALVITESALPSLLRPGFETVPLQESCTTNWLIVQYYSWDLHLNIFHTIYFT